jgi:VWFA-related protein
MVRALVVLVVASAAAVAALAQQASASQQIFRAGTDVARLTVRVLDTERRPVRGLTAADFTVVINNVPQPIVGVFEEDLSGPVHVTAPWLRDVASDVATNTVANPRLIVIVLDDAMLGSSLKGSPWSLKQSKAIARAIIGELGPSDLAAVVFTGNNRAPQDFTNDRARLIDAVERFQDIAIPPFLAGLYSLETVRRTIDYLKDVPSLSSAIFWITPGRGGDRDALIPRAVGPGAGIAVREEELTLLEKFGRLVGGYQIATVPIYPISNKGLQAPTVARDGTIRMPAFGASHMLGDIAAATGGRSISDTNAPSAAVPALFRELSSRYIVGYRVTHPEADARYRRLRVRVNRRDVIVEPSERMFLAPTAKQLEAGARDKPVATTQALAGLIPVVDEPLRLVLTPLAMASPVAKGSASHPVAVSLGVDVPFASDQPGGDNLSFEMRVFDGEGRKEITTRRWSATLAPPPDRTRGRYDIHTVVALPPGRYNVRLAMHSTARQSSGSVYTDISVPDFARDLLSLSGVVITASPEVQPYFVERSPDALPVLPVTSREFATMDRVSAWMRVYWGGNRPPSPVVVRAELVDDLNATVQTWTADLVPAPSATSPSADHRLELPIDRLRPGEYLLTLRALPVRGAELRRHVRFRVH